MEEKKQAKKWSYSTSGKAVRGLLCMITFCVFIAGLAFSSYGIFEYGYNILWESDVSYFDTAGYALDLQSEVMNLLLDVEKLYQYKNVEGNFSIVDVGNNLIYYYDLKQLMEDFDGTDAEFPDRLESLEPYRVLTKKCDCDFADISSVIQFLKSDAAKGSYIYLDSDAFVGLFLKNGAINTDYRFLSAFSKEAYFIFDDVDHLMKYQGFDWNKKEETGSFNIENVGYAVYNPVENVFYSTWDEYFKPNDVYIYSSEELANIIQENNISNSRMNSIVIPMLWSYNYSWNFLREKVSVLYNDYLNTVENLEARKESGFLYYIENSDFRYTNVEDITDIASRKYSYKMSGKKVFKSVDTGMDITKLPIYKTVKASFDKLPEDTLFYFGYARDRSQGENDIITVNNLRYTFMRNYIWYFLIITVVSLILLMFQAAWMICTTGRLEKSGKEIRLNRYDKLVTEVWILLTVGILLISTVWVRIGIVVNSSRVWARIGIVVDSSRMQFVMLMAIAATLPFAFCFMVLTLSFARRIKAHNLWNHLYSRKIWNGINHALKEFYHSRRDIERILSIFVGYVILESISIWFMKKSVILGLILFFALQVAAFIVVYRMISDIKTLTKRISQITNGNLDYKCPISNKHSLLKELDYGINHIGDGLKAAVETSLKDERMKTELITNVSHDLKTPLTSIINYVDLLKKEKMPTKEAIHYLEVLESKSHRLKQLTEDLVEAAKANSGNIELEKMPLAFDELMKQAIGEIEDKFEKKNLTVVAHYPEEKAMVMADGRRMFRIMENVLQNAYKYALEGTRIYADLSNNQSVVTFTLKNVSAAPLNISPEELMERFTRGDESRTTEGSGLGLSIAKDLTRLQDGTFDIVLDGDLFKVIITFPEYSV